jgi:hypothetical protein
VSEEYVVYVCKRCTTSAGEDGTCVYCGGEKVACRPGDEGDPIRRPLIDEHGKVLTRAPIWWLRLTIPALMDQEDS